MAAALSAAVAQRSAELQANRRALRTELRTALGRDAFKVMDKPAKSAKESYATGVCVAKYGANHPLGGGKLMEPCNTGIKNQWETGLDPDDANHSFDNLFTVDDEGAEDRGIKPPDMTAIFRKPETAELVTKKAMIMDWLAAISGVPGGVDVWNKAKALAMMKLGKKEAADVGAEWPYAETEEGAKEFATDYLPVVMGEDVPVVEKKFPGFVPTGTYKDSGRGIKKGTLAKRLRTAYMEFMEQYDYVRAWTEKERDLLKWYERVGEETTKKDKRTILAADIAPYTKCPKRFCSWTISGVSKPFMAPPQGWEPDNPDTTCAYAKQYHKAADPDNGKAIETWDHRDDGRGDEGRLERYKQAYKDHLGYIHAHDPKKAIHAKAPTFKMRMTPDEFQEQKEVWKRFCITYPDNTPELYYDMLQQSIDMELIKIIDSDMKAMKNQADDESVEKIMKVIEKNAVIRVSNEVYLTAFEKIKQEEGEMVEPYLSRLRSAATKMELKTRGTCNSTSHPNSSNPCTAAREWMEMVNKKILDDGETYISDEEIDGKKCPECCKDVDDVERKRWMIKKQFLNNLRVDNHKKQIMMRLQQTFTQKGLSKKFDALKFNLGYITMVAVQIEEIYENKTKTIKVDGAASEVAKTPKQRKGAKKGQGDKREKKKNQGKKDTEKPRTPGLTPEGKCTGCGKEPHGAKVDGKHTNGVEDRKKNCEAWDKECQKCKKKGHNARVCRQKPPSGGAGNEEGKEPHSQQGAGAQTTAVVDWNEPQWPGGPYMGPAERDWTMDYGKGPEAAGATTSMCLGDDKSDGYYASCNVGKTRGMFGTGGPYAPSAPPQDRLYPDLEGVKQQQQQTWEEKDIRRRCKDKEEEISFTCNLIKKKLNKSWDHTDQGNGGRGGAKQ